MFFGVVGHNGKNGKPDINTAPPVGLAWRSICMTTSKSTGNLETVALT